MSEFHTLPLVLQILCYACAVVFAAGLGFGAGKSGLGNLLAKNGGPKTEQKVELNLGKSRQEASRCPNPEDCPAHEEEHNRSIRNEENITKLFGRLDAIGQDLGEVKGMVTVLVQQSGGRK